MQRVCRRCVMDTSDPDIVFDDEGFCNHCTGALALQKKLPYPGLDDLIQEMKTVGDDKEYDCLVGLSGGVDSCYVLWYVKSRGLCPLAFHLDNEWDTALSKRNVERVTRKLGVKLVTKTVDWEMFRDLQLSFLKSGTPDLEIPTDHALIASLYQVSSEYGIKYIVSGHNLMTESIAVPKWSHGHYDWRYIKSINHQFGSLGLYGYPHLSMLMLLRQQVLQKKRIIRLINYLPWYDKNKVMGFLKDEFGWESYHTKHGESLYTFFVQAYVLPVKFGYDKRRMHLSNLICAGQMTRDDALRELANPLFSSDELEEMITTVCGKLGIARSVFDAMMKLPNKSYYDYPSYDSHLVYRLMRDMYKKVKTER